MTVAFQTARFTDLIEQYLAVRRRRYGYVSLRAAQKALAQIAPSDALPGRDFDDLVARHAVAHGLYVDFDRQDGELG